MVMNTKKLKWYDLKLKKYYTPKEYTVKIKNKRRYGLAKSPHSKVVFWRVLGMAKK